jgi:hypothetical protein
VSRGNAFAVAVDQAGGALTWNTNPDVRAALTAAAQKSTTPLSLGTGAPGHMVFAERGMSVWSADALEFLGRYLTRPAG